MYADSTSPKGTGGSGQFAFLKKMFEKYFGGFMKDINLNNMIEDAENSTKYCHSQS